MGLDMITESSNKSLKTATKSKFQTIGLVTVIPGK